MSASWDEVLRPYRAILRDTGGEYGFVSDGTLRYLVETIEILRGHVFAKAAYAMHEAATKHPPVNGNKRLAFALGALLLRKEGYELLVEVDETARPYAERGPWRTLKEGRRNMASEQIEEDVIEEIIRRHRAVLMALAKY